VPASSIFFYKYLLGSEVQHRSEDSTAGRLCSDGCRGKMILREELCEVGNTESIGQRSRVWGGHLVAALFLDLNPRWGRVG
jgi:hypothetical protein